ncbi:hypothetical protein BDB01DRAFT_785328 [Pilobolus umbonatus]|nr:hypothetical protein BDB01DRAFT_785328 [Pilobolus umbonatus]
MRLSTYAIGAIVVSLMSSFSSKTAIFSFTIITSSFISLTISIKATFSLFIFFMACRSNWTFIPIERSKMNIKLFCLEEKDK